MRSVRTIILSLFLLILTFLSLAARCLYLQYVRNTHYISACEKQLLGRTIKKPRRGVILDCRGRVLAASNQVQTIFAEPRIIKDPEATSQMLAPILNMSAQQICKLITDTKNPGFAKIKINAPPAQCDDAAKIYGIGFQSDWKRHYPMAILAAHVVGFTGADNQGLYGIELQCDKDLRGSAGQNSFFTDPRRRPIRPKRRINPLKDGVGIILTLDATIQQFAHDELQKQYKNYQAESAVAIVAEPKTAAILAMVSLPDFDPDDIRFADPNNLRNRAISDQFEPGSIIKPIVAAIALDTGTATLHEKIFCEQGDYRGKGFGRIGEYRNHRYGYLTIRQILIKSSNIGMAKIGQRLGKEKLFKGLRLFGFGKKTAIDLPGEAQGLLHPPQNWTGYSLTRIPFGQEISVSAIQLLRAFCILANGGHAVRPHLVKAMVDNNGNIVKLKEPPPPVGFVVKPEVAKWIVTDAMVGAVNEKKNGATGWRANLDKWQVFGKTGTADIAKSDQRGYSDSDCIASFVAGAPPQDPAVIVLVSIRKPNKKLGKGYTGGAVASPVAAAILEKTLKYLAVPERKKHIPSTGFTKHLP